MTTPKHLWSGDWEHDSETAQTSRPLPPPPSTEPPPAPPPPPATGIPWRFVAVTVIAALAITGVVWALTSSGSSPTHRPRHHGQATTPTARTPFGLTQPQTTPTTPTVPGVSPGTPQIPSPGTGTIPTSSANADSLGLQLSLVQGPPGSSGDRVIVSAVVPGSAAETVGIGAGDLLLTVNGQKVTSPGQANGIIDKIPKGSQVTLQLVQGSEQITASITESNGP